MPRRLAKDHDSKRQHILKIAAEVFARDGIARASMNEVAKACHISKANIYHYYASKNELIFDILDTYLSALRALICDLDRGQSAPTEELRAIIRAFLFAYEGMDKEHKIQSEGLPYLEPAQQEILKSYQRDLVEQVSSVLRLCAPEKLGRDPLACRQVSMSIFGMLNWFYMWNPQASVEVRQSYADSIADLTLNGILEP